MPWLWGPTHDMAPEAHGLIEAAAIRSVEAPEMLGWQPITPRSVQVLRPRGDAGAWGLQFGSTPGCVRLSELAPIENMRP